LYCSNVADRYLIWFLPYLGSSLTQLRCNASDNESQCPRELTMFTENNVGSCVPPVSLWIRCRRVYSLAFNSQLNQCSGLPSCISKRLMIPPTAPVLPLVQTQPMATKSSVAILLSNKRLVIFVWIFLDDLLSVLSSMTQIL